MCSMVVKFFYEVTKEMTCQENFYTYYDEAPFFCLKDSVYDFEYC